jgi:hypothetical protein
VATANQTTFSGNDAASNSLAYDAGFLDVYLSGIKLVNGTDFTASSGTSIVLSAGVAVNEILEIIAYGTFVLANFNADQLDGQHGSYYTGYTDSAVSALVDSSPAALNTLNELAAALGDDVNFSTTVTNSIATKAPIASPTFTGTATIPTADINAGTIDGTVIGGTTAAAISGTTGQFGTSLNVDGTATMDAVALNTTLKTWDANTDAVQFQSGSLWNYSTSQLNLGQNEYYNGGYKYLTTGAASTYNQASGGHFFKTAVSGSADGAITWVDVLGIDAAGRVGIGTSSFVNANAKLVVSNGTVDIEHYTDTAIGYVGTRSNHPFGDRKSVV